MLLHQPNSPLFFLSWRLPSQWRHLLPVLPRVTLHFPTAFSRLNTACAVSSFCLSTSVRRPNRLLAAALSSDAGAGCRSYSTSSQLPRPGSVDVHVESGKPAGQSEIIFLGTGTSEGVPRVSCLTHPFETCKVCAKAAKPGDKNRRLNTSILIRHTDSSKSFNIVVDVGKFFYHSAINWFPTFGIRTIDAVIITHSHADAIGGLDDLRDWTNNVQPNIPIYVTDRDFEVMKKTHYYLVDKSVVLPGAAVSEIQFKIIGEAPFVVHDLKVIPLPVFHGKGYQSLGYRFGNVCYISDVSEIPDETYTLLKDCELLILDALRPGQSSSTHFGLSRALEEVRKIHPKRTLLTGMNHEMDHDEVNADLLKLLEMEGLDVQLAYDGLRIPLSLSATDVKVQREPLSFG